MVMRFLYGLWNGGGPLPGSRAGSFPPGPPAVEDDDAPEIDAADPVAPIGSKRRKQAEDLAAHHRLELERTEKNEREEESDDEQWLWLLRVAVERRNDFIEFANDLEDAIRAMRLAHERASLVEQQAREALEEVQGRALVLPDGRRAYFTNDGRTLYGEDGREITDAAAIEAARRLRSSKPDAPDYETYAAKKDRLNTATERAQQFADALHRLDDLNEKLKAGKITPDELAQARKEEQNIIDSPPPAVREDYERLRAARKAGSGIAYREADPVLESAPNLNAHFVRADAALSPLDKADEKQSGQDLNRLPAYRSAPDF